MESFYGTIKFILHVEERRVNKRKKESVPSPKAQTQILLVPCRVLVEHIEHTYEHCKEQNSHSETCFGIVGCPVTTWTHD